MDLLRFITCGSVDDGKSTLIGRLLYDSKSLQVDLIEAIQASSKKRGGSELDLSLLTDGLKSEREQGITIDVAYKYFSTAKKKYIIADTPGHFQYTRNMVTGASTANLAIILIDARKGVIEQTKRHTYITQLLCIPNLVIAINKMDLVDYSQNRFNEIKNDFINFYEKLLENLNRDKLDNNTDNNRENTENNRENLDNDRDNLENNRENLDNDRKITDNDRKITDNDRKITDNDRKIFTKKNKIYFIPISALNGDNVVESGDQGNMNWYEGKTLLNYLDDLELENNKEKESMRFVVQGSIRPRTIANYLVNTNVIKKDENSSKINFTDNFDFQDFRGYSGQVWGGVMGKGMQVKVLPSNQKSKIKNIYLGSKNLDKAFAPMSITITLENELDISRGNFLVEDNDDTLKENEMQSSSNFIANICWMDSNYLKINDIYILRCGANFTNITITDIKYKIDLHTLQHVSSPPQLELNDIAKISFKSQGIIYHDAFSENRFTGSFILIESSNFSTVGAGMFE